MASCQDRSVHRDLVDGLYDPWLPVRVQTQGDLGQIVEGTHGRGPEHHPPQEKGPVGPQVSRSFSGDHAGSSMSGWLPVADVERLLQRAPTPIGGTNG